MHQAPPGVVWTHHFLSHCQAAVLERLSAHTVVTSLERVKINGQALKKGGLQDGVSSHGAPCALCLLSGDPRVKVGGWSGLMTGLTHAKEHGAVYLHRTRGAVSDGDSKRAES